MKSRQKALLVAGLARAKKAEDLVILDIRKLSNLTDFFIIGTASSARRAQAIAEIIEKELLQAGQSLAGIEGYREGRWILIDAYDIVAHIFNNESRRFYNLERLWGDAPRLRLCQKGQKKQKKLSKKTSRRK